MSAPHFPRKKNGKAKANIKQRYGLSFEQLEEMWRQCNGLCVICETRPPVCVDHNHDTQKIRGLLCKQCNTGIGMLGDDQMRLAKALCYLVQHDRKESPVRPSPHKGRGAGSGKPLPKNDPRRPKS